ncbi:hypothetical protein BP5796_11181 [Coleophoma crateriformis]|uniref:Phosphoribosylaminoimidazole-succinocarboxamide synthase n=1 Tax=Coleophoma crateriformis TaxID=565419 RepID=A0A3D8QHN8_9HELO|nr:hypothetical protein BP5796_11181 [Coleophoma crateriformis]
MEPERLGIRNVHCQRPKVTYNLSEHSIAAISNQRSRSSSRTSRDTRPDSPTRWATPSSQLLTPPRTPQYWMPETERFIDADGTSERSPSELGRGLDGQKARSTLAHPSERVKMSEVDLGSGPVTPLNDDTPYIRFAIEQLTRDEEFIALTRPDTASSLYSYPIIQPGYGLGFWDCNANDQDRRSELSLRMDRDSLKEEGLFKFNPTRPLSDHSTSNLGSVNLGTSFWKESGDVFIPIVHPSTTTAQYIGPTFVPIILRRFSMAALSLLCILMISAIIFCAIYSTRHEGLTAYTGSIYGNWYFIFGFFPQLLGAFIFIYVECVMATVGRISPFALMAMDDAKDRTNALFLDLYPKSLLWPRCNGDMMMTTSNLLCWLVIFTIPLQSSLFSAVPVSGGWRWATVQAVAWTLVVIYFLVLVGIISTSILFSKRATGLIWDPRSLADIVALLPQSNILKDFPGTETMESRRQIRQRLALRSGRLGYWRTPRTQTAIHGIGEEGAPTRQYTISEGKLHEKLDDGQSYRSVDVEGVAALYSPRIRFRYLPWFLRNTYLILWVVAAFILLLSLVVVSFLPWTMLSKGILPIVSALPNSSGFAPANFFYSFVPSLLGLLLYLFFQPLDRAFRKLQPWKELSHAEGAIAEKSLLLEYTAALPLFCTFAAVNAGHYRVAILSLLSLAFVLLPVLAGGLLFPLTTPAGEVRMIPDMGSFYVLLVLLIFYFLGLALAIPNRQQMYLPHAVDCLAEVVSFVHGSHILDDVSFRAPATRTDLVTHFMAGQQAGSQARYAFGVYHGRHGKECLGIDRLGRKGA